MDEKRIYELENQVAGLTQSLRILRERVNARKSSPAEPRSRNGRPLTRCLCCGGSAEIQHTGGERMAIICSECKCQMRIPVEIVKPPDADCLRRVGCMDTCLGLCGDKERDIIEPAKAKAKAEAEAEAKAAAR